MAKERNAKKEVKKKPALTMKEKATEDRKQRAHISRYRKALITAGEVQFGIYFDLESEMERINDGLRIRCDIRS